jgi:hypothetical protein
MTKTCNPPTSQKLDVRFSDETFPASATIAFAPNDGKTAAPARQTTVLAGRGGTWTLAFTPNTPLLKGA